MVALMLLLGASALAEDAATPDPATTSETTLPPPDPSSWYLNVSRSWVYFPLQSGVFVDLGK